MREREGEGGSHSQCYLNQGTLWYVVQLLYMVPSLVCGAVSVGLVGMLFRIAYTPFIVSTKHIVQWNDISDVHIYIG